ncbi:MAG: hypothetical protein ABR502_12610 [Chitinophagaceae bacterium]
MEVNEQFDPLLFKNVLQDVTTKLSQKGLNKPSIEKLLNPVKELISNDEFWKLQSNGLALFVADGFFKYIRLTMTPTEEIIIENSFYVTPLIPAMTSKEFFYLLVISKKQVKLFIADAFGMQYIPVEGLLQHMDDVQAEDEETTLHTANRTGSGGPNFYEISGINTVNSKANIATYLEAADDIIWKEILHNETAPLLLAGVEYLIPIYKSVTNYKNVWEDALTGSHEHEDTATLYHKAKEKMRPYFQQRVEKAIQIFGNQSATEFTSSIPSDVISATYYARVSHLFVQNGAHIWGTFNEANNELKFHDKQKAESEDLIDNAVVKTLATGGEVFLLEKEKMPADSVIAAIMRY